MNLDEGAIRALQLAGVSVLTPLGNRLEQLFWALEAGLSAYELDETFFGEQEPISLARVPEAALLPVNAVVPAAALDPLQTRLLRLAVPPLRELLEKAGTASPIPLLLAAPEALPGGATAVEPGLLQALSQYLEGLDLGRSSVLPRGRAALPEALAAAARLLLDGSCSQVIVGGVDSWLDARLLSLLRESERLLAPAAEDGFAPGEGAGFLLLRKGAAHAWPLRFGGLGGTFEPGHLFSDSDYSGEALAGALSMALASVTEPVQSAYTNFNGELFFAKEWGVAHTRNHAAFAENARIMHPADSLGDLGAATGSVYAALAAYGISKGQGAAVIALSSELGLRGAVTLIPEPGAPAGLGNKA